MTLQELRSYYNLRQYQISHLLNAQEFFKLYCNGKNFDQQMWLYLFYWADAMWEADALWLKLGNTDAYWQSRGKA